jgi:hypothetical protein
VDIYKFEGMYYTVPVYARDILKEKKGIKPTQLAPEVKIGRGEKQM